jgi:hypothetical protein
VWSTVSVIRNVYVAPRERFAELRAVGARITGEGPTLVLDHELYADRYFLRDAAPDGATDIGYRSVAHRDGVPYPADGPAEVDDVALGDLWRYRTLVRRPSPAVSRPPTGYRRIVTGHLWEVWQRDPDAKAPLRHLALGSGFDPTGKASCDDIAALAAERGAEHLVAARRPPPVMVELPRQRLPRAWRTSGGVVASQGGRATVSTAVQQDARYEVWLQGAVAGRMSVLVDGKTAASLIHDLAHAGQWMSFGSEQLATGEHEVELRYDGLLRSGIGFPPPYIGPLALARADTGETVTVPVGDYRSLCTGDRYDWIEAVGD